MTQQKKCMSRGETKCTRPGNQIILGFYLCPQHEVELLTELTRRDSKRKEIKRQKEGAARKRAEAKKARDKAARRVAVEACGRATPRIDLHKAGGLSQGAWEVQGGLPSLGKNQ